MILIENLIQFYVQNNRYYTFRVQVHKRMGQGEKYG